MTEARSHIIEVGNLGFEGGEGCDLARIINSLVESRERTEDLQAINGLEILRHLIVEINGAKRAGDCAKPEFGEIEVEMEEYGSLGRIAVMLDAPEELDEALCKAFAKCVNCPKPIQRHSETFITIDGKTMTSSEWEQQIKDGV